MNIVFQIFTYAKERSVFDLVSVLKSFLDEETLFVHWVDHYGGRKKLKYLKLLEGGDPDFRLNRFSIKQSPRKMLEFDGVKDAEFGANFNVSPNSLFWAHSSSKIIPGKEKIRNVISEIVSAEKCALYHSESIIPSVLEVTISTSSDVEFMVVDELADRIARQLPAIRCNPVYMVVDYASDWLFFPTNGVNPSNSDYNVYINHLCGKIAKASWLKWRNIHNISMTCDFALFGDQVEVCRHGVAPKELS